MNEVIKEVCEDSVKAYKKMAELKGAGDVDKYKTYKDCLEAYEHYTRGETPMPQDMKDAKLAAWNGVKEHLFPVKEVVLEEPVKEVKKIKKAKK